MRLWGLTTTRRPSASALRRAIDIALLIGLVLVGLGNLALPASGQSVLGIDYLAVALVTLGAAICMRARTSMRRKTVWALIVVLGLSTAPGFFTSRLNDYGIQKLETFIIVAILLIAAASLRQARAASMWFMTVVVALSVLFSLLMLFANEKLPNDRVTLEGLNPVGVARLAAVGIPIIIAALVVWGRGRTTFSVGGILILTLCTVGAALTGSRAPLLSAALASGAAWWMGSRGSPRERLWKSPAFVVLLVLTSAAITVAAVLGTLGSLGARGASGRSDLYSAAFESILSDPIGIGWGSFGSVVGRDNAKVYPHNLFLEVGAEGGLIALISMIGVTVWCAVSAFRAFRETKTATSLMIAAFYIFSLVNAQFSSDIVGNRMLWVAIALVVAQHSWQDGIFIQGHRSVDAQDGGNGQGGAISVQSESHAHMLIVEPRHSGHLLLYVKLAAEAALARGDNVTLALGPGVVESDEYARHLAELDVPLQQISSPVSLASCQELAADVGATTVAIPHGDELLLEVSLGRWTSDARLVLLVMRDPRWEFPAPPRRIIRSVVKLVAADAASARPRVDVVWLRQITYRGRLPHVKDPYVADGTLEEIRAEGERIRDTLKMSTDRFWFVVTGAITDRKNVPLVVDALCSMAAEDRYQNALGLALIGPLRLSSPALVSDLETQARASGLELVIDDRDLSNFEMNAAVSSADAVVMAYSTHSPNSTMVKAHAIGVRLVVAGPWSVRRFARDLGMQHVSPLRPRDLRASLEASISACRPEPSAVATTTLDLT